MDLLKGKRALVTGGAVNIGAAVSRQLARAGADVAVVYHKSSDAAQVLTAEIEAMGNRSLALQTDVSREEDFERLFSTIADVWGGLDILVNNSGIFSSSSQGDLSLEEWNKIWQVNMTGLFLSCRGALPLLGRGSSVINIASINAFHPGFGNTAHYDATKGGVVAYTRSLAAEWAPKGIRVNSISPGLVDLPKLREHNSDLATDVEGKTPLGSLVKPEDVGDSAVFLASSLASQVTGQSIIVDGGYTIG